MLTSVLDSGSAMASNVLTLRSVEILLLELESQMPHHVVHLRSRATPLRLSYGNRVGGLAAISTCVVERGVTTLWFRGVGL